MRIDAQERLDNLLATDAEAAAEWAKFQKLKRDPRVTVLAFNPFRPRDRPLPSWRAVGRGGWLETIAFAESVIAGALAATAVKLALALLTLGLAPQSPALGPGAAIGLVAGAFLLAMAAVWVLLMRHVRTLCAADDEC